MAQDDNFALHERQLLQRPEQLVVVIDLGGGIATGPVRQFAVLLAPPSSAAPVDIGPDDDLPQVGLFTTVTSHARPGKVELDERVLQHIVGSGPVATDRVRDAPEVRLSGCDERDVGVVSGVHGVSANPAVASTRSFAHDVMGYWLAAAFTVWMRPWTSATPTQTLPSPRVATATAPVIPAPRS